jgi:DICT domain-containing protein/CheY-like chemotaxis protein
VGDEADPTPILQDLLDAVGDRAVPTTVPKATLIELCHTLEELVLDEGLHGAIAAGFQRGRFFDVERERYRDLAGGDHRLVLVFTGDGTAEAAPIHHIVTGRDHPLAQDWFLVVLTPRFGAAVVGRELAGERAVGDVTRRFLTVWTFDAGVVNDVVQLLATAGHDVSETATDLLRRAREWFPPPPAPESLQQRFVNSMFERLEAAQLRLRDTPPSQAMTTPPRDTGRRALVVDDEPAIRGLLEALLRRAGWEVFPAEDGHGARRVLEAGPVDAVLLDVQLGAEQGPDLLEELERIRPGTAAHTVFITGDPPGSGWLKGRPALAKPLSWADLQAVLASLPRDLNHG